MKRLDLVRIIEQNGAVFVRHGSDYDWYKNRKPALPSPFPVTERSKKYWQKNNQAAFVM
ncbi:type II toxin-antitoxin system HicA family toxin [Treponema sp. R80B11-R83G3]